MEKISSEKRTVTYMIGLYCRKKHNSNSLCGACEQLNKYAHDRLTKCPFGDNKSACTDCKIHCYNANMRERIRSVMRFSGPRMLFYYPLDYVKHWFKKSPL